MSEKDLWQKISIFIITTVWIIISVPLLIKHHLINGIESTDSYFYLKIAEETQKGRFTDPVYSPGYSWFIALLLPLIDVEMAGRIISLIFGALTLIFSGLFLLELERKEMNLKQEDTKEEGEEKKAKKADIGSFVPLFAVIFTAFNPKFMTSSVSTLPYTASAFFLWITLYLSVISERSKGGKKRSIFLSFLGGATSGVGYIVRPENILSAPMYFLIAKNKKFVVPFIIGFIFITTPYHIITLKEKNLPSIVAKFIRYKVPEAEFEIKKVTEKRGQEDLKIKEISEKVLDMKNYLRYFISNIHLTHKYVLPGILTSSWIIILGMGIPGFIRRSRLYILRIILTIAIWIFPIFPLIILADYMLLPILPAFGAIAGHFYLSFKRSEMGGQEGKEKSEESMKIKYIIATVVVVLLNLFYSMRPFYSDDGRMIYRLAGQWIKENLGEGRKIFEPFPFATFYAKGLWQIKPDDAEILVESSFDFISARAIPELIILPHEKIEYARMLTEIRYKGKVIRIFKN